MATLNEFLEKALNDIDEERMERRMSAIDSPLGQMKQFKKKLLGKFYDLDDIIAEAEWSKMGYDKQRNIIMKAMKEIDKAIQSMR